MDLLLSTETALTTQQTVTLSSRGAQGCRLLSASRRTDSNSNCYNTKLTLLSVNTPINGVGLILGHNGAYDSPSPTCLVSSVTCNNPAHARERPLRSSNS